MNHIFPYAVAVTFDGFCRCRPGPFVFLVEGARLVVWQGRCIILGRLFAVVTSVPLPPAMVTPSHGHLGLYQSTCCRISTRCPLAGLPYNHGIQPATKPASDAALAVSFTAAGGSGLK